VCVCHPSYGGKPKIEELEIQARLSKKQDFTSKITRFLKRAGGMAQAPEYPSSSCKALSSNLNTTKGRKKKKKKKPKKKTGSGEVAQAI
jgi:hypothetical protein